MVSRRAPKISRKNHLDRHMQEVHNIVTNINLDFASRDFKKTRKFKCELCGTVFTRNETLKRHKIILHEVVGKNLEVSTI